MRILELTEETRKNLQEDLLKRSPNSYTEYEARVNEIIGQVRERRDEAVFSYTKQFDGAELGPETVRVSKEEVEAAYQNTEPGLIEVMKKSLDNIRAYHEKQKQYSWFDSRPDGVLLGQKVTALEKVGVYVPGGKASYPSSVLMNVIPAKVAGVQKIVMVTPCSREGNVNPATLAAADDLPDVFLLQGMNTKAWAEQGLVMDLTDVVNNSPYAADYKQDYFTPFKDGDGKIYGLPVLTGGTCTVVVYDKQMWKDAGYDSFPAT